MDTSCTEIEDIFKKGYTKLKPSGLLRVDVSVVSAFQRNVCRFEYQVNYEMFLLDCFFVKLDFPTYNNNNNNNNSNTFNRKCALAR